MRNINKRPRKLMRVRDKNRANGIKNQQQKSISMILFLIRLGLEEQNTAEKLLARLRLHIEKLTGNANFPVTDPPVADLQDMADDLEADIDAVAAGNKALIPHRNGLEEDAREMIRQLSYNIQYLSHGDEEKIKSAGFDVHKVSTPSASPGQVMNLTATPAGPDKIKLKWDKEPNSVVNVIQQANNLLQPFPPGVNWELTGKTRKVSFTIQGLIPGQVYYFRVYGITERRTATRVTLQSSAACKYPAQINFFRNLFLRSLNQGGKGRVTGSGVPLLAERSFYFFRCFFGR